MPRRAPLVVALLFIGATLSAESFRSLLSTVVRSPLILLQSVAQTLAWWPMLPALFREQASLRRELTERQLELIRFREADRQRTRTDRLREAMPGPGVPASILGRSILPTEHMLILDRGRRHGIEPDAVLVDVRGLVGRVLHVEPSTSTAVLLTDPTSRVAGLIERSRESGLLVGTGTSLLEFAYLDLDADLLVGDQVVTAGLGGPFPKGVPIGAVIRIDRDERRASTRAWVRPAVKLRQLEDVLCLPPAALGEQHGDETAVPRP